MPRDITNLSMNTTTTTTNPTAAATVTDNLAAIASEEELREEEELSDTLNALNARLKLEQGFVVRMEAGIAAVESCELLKKLEKQLETYNQNTKELEDIAKTLEEENQTEEEEEDKEDEEEGVHKEETG